MAPSRDRTAKDAARAAADPARAEAGGTSRPAAGAPVRPGDGGPVRPAATREAARSRIARPTLSREKRLARLHGGPVAGIDEAGRGPLAGPVVAAAVVLDPKAVPAGLNDSKKLAAAERDRLYDLILAAADVSVALASPARIDAMNIRGATLWAMCAALRGLAERPAAALIDGRDVPPDLPCHGEFLIQGDGLSLSVAAASIVAKVTRDRLMTRLCETFPGYGFSSHKGYGTAEHQAALARLGPCPHHRRSFAPVRALCEA